MKETKIRVLLHILSKNEATTIKREGFLNILPSFLENSSIFVKFRKKNEHFNNGICRITTWTYF